MVEPILFTDIDIYSIVVMYYLIIILLILLFY